MALVIPPVWQHVWISPWPNGHIQATGIDAAGRKQYLYYMEWSTRRHTQKFERVVGFGAALPRARQIVAEHLVDSDFSKDRVLATTSVRTGCWRRPSGCSTADIFGSAVRWCTPRRTGASALATEHPDGLPGVPYRPSVHRRIRTESAHHDRGQLGDAQPGKCPARGRRRKDRRHRPDDGGRHAVGGKGRAQTVADLELRAGMALPAPPPSRIPHRRPGPRGIPSPHLRAPLPASCFPSAQRLNSARRRAVLDRHG